MCCRGCNLLWFLGDDWRLVIGTVKVNGEGRKVFLNYRDERRMKQQMMTSELLSAGFTHTHTQLHKNCSHCCSSSFLSPFGFLSACCLATRNPTMWLGCDSPGDATSWACSTRHTYRHMPAQIDIRLTYVCISVLQLHTECAQEGVSACAWPEICRLFSF